MSDEDDSSELALAAAVARRHYLKHENNVQIAQALDITRFKVARLLEKARAAGLVHVEIQAPPTGDDVVAEALREQFSLRGCVIVRGVGEDGIVPAIAEVAAGLLESIATRDDVLGLPWSRTAHAAVQALDRLPPMPVVQLTGSIITPGQSTSFELARDAAALTRGEEFFFQAPLVMPTASGAEAVRRQQDVVRAMKAVENVTLTLCSVGAWTRGASTVFDSLSPEAVAATAKDGIVGESMGVFFGDGGRPLTPSISRRLIGISFEQLSAIPTVILMSRSLVRLAATRSILLSGVADYLIVDQALAEALVYGDRPVRRLSLR